MTDPPAEPKPVRLLALSGSLRAASANPRVQPAVTRLAPPGVEVHLDGGIGGLNAAVQSRATGRRLAGWRPEASPS